MIPIESRVYYVDPLQSALPPVSQKRDRSPLPVEVLVTRYRRNSRAENIGKVIPATRVVHVDYDMWWVDDHGDYFQGAQVLDRVVRHMTGHLLALVDDDVFVVGRSNGEHHATGEATLIDVKRSDNKGLPGHNRTTGTTYVSNRVVKAAPWALDLMPVAGDTQAIVDQKVMIAKLKFEQRVKKAEIYKEGMRRDWLNQLDTLRPAHDMPTPTFRIGVSGTYVRQLSNPIEVDGLPEADKTALNEITERVVRPDVTGRLTAGTMQQFVGVPFTTVTPLFTSNYAGLGAVSRSDLDYAVSNSLGQHGGLVIEQDRFPILHSF